MVGAGTSFVTALTEAPSEHLEGVDPVPMALTIA